ncbi:C13 family peptidase [Terrarubrum flagellatum]|uniref:C13 family peptidase n=1 Tax=Terrirubrum flagellatum TaxID=2895980 RepID=UPI003145384E
MLERVCAFLFAALLFCAGGDASAQRVHYLGVAASNEQNVFINEANGAASVLAQKYPLASSATISNGFGVGADLAGIRNAIFEAAGRMDRERDILFLLVTSHGVKGRGVVLRGPGLLQVLTPGQLRSFLAEAGVKNRVVVISACYSGQFIGPLSGPTSAVITASDAAHPSFGCQNDRNYTWFGEALFSEAMPRARDLRSAFAIARQTVTAWERRDGQIPSNPQMSMGGQAARMLAAAR